MPGRSASGAMTRPRSSCSPPRCVSVVANADDRGQEPERRRRRTRRGRSRIVEQHLAEHGPEREPAVHRDRPVAHRLAAPLLRREVGDHRRGADEEAASPNPMSTRVADQPLQRLDAPAYSAVDARRSARRRSSSTRRPKRSPMRPASGRSRIAPTANAPTATPTATSSPPERLLDVVREHRAASRPAREVAEARDDHDHEARGHERRLRRDRAVGAAAPHDARARSSASSNDARSAIIRRYCMTWRAWRSRARRRGGRRGRTARRTGAPRASRARPPCRRRRGSGRRSGSCGRTGRTTRTAPARTARARRRRRTSRRRAAATPCSVALVQCSSRMSSPSNSGFGQRATSPAATTPGAASSVSSHTTPLSSVSPEPSSQSVSGTTPTPTTTTSASTALPSSSRTRSTLPSPSIAATPTPRRRSTPWSRCSSPHTMPSSGPRPRTIGAGSASSTVTSRPRPRHVAATSAPMNPAPITTTRGSRVERGRGARARRRACAARTCRRGRGCRGACAASRRWRARGRRTAATRDPVAGVEGEHLAPPRRARWRARRGAARGRGRRTPRLRSTRSCGSHSPASSSFESGGRSYGRWGSAPTSTIRPSKPSRRSVSVARSPASEAPTTTTVCNAVVLSSTRAGCRHLSRRPSPGRASTPVQGGRTRVDGTALTGCPGARSVAENPPWAGETLDVLTFRVVYSGVGLSNIPT